MNKKAILLMGPTATGKTELALKLSSQYPIEIISVDSALIYKDMNIGTAKPTLTELNIVQHHLIDIITPLMSYSVAQFLEDTNSILRNILQRGKIPVLVGGTMMYYNAIFNGISILPESNAEIRSLLEERATAKGLSSLYRELSDVDEVTAAKINVNDQQRIIRALEVYYITKKPMSILQQETKVNLFNDISFLPLAILPKSREVLHDRINHRFDKMLKHGFIDEVIYLRSKYAGLTVNDTSMRSVGYNQVWQYLDGQIDFDQMVDRAKAATRQLAKRQTTWLRSMNTINLANNSFDLDTLYNELEQQVNLFV
ncbi:MAG: tRNA (adenosine(37)-N6)-dimethylallyltransferase MiaA [Neisseriaceae bacterium]|jgi:tRNA dimethylallyltransferase